MPWGPWADKTVHLFYLKLCFEEHKYQRPPLFVAPLTSPALGVSKWVVLKRLSPLQGQPREPLCRALWPALSSFPKQHAHRSALPWHASYFSSFALSASGVPVTGEVAGAVCGCMG